VYLQAKAETVQKVSDIVKEQLALAADVPLTAESKFSALGADSLDTVCYTLSVSYHCHVIFPLFHNDLMFEN